MRILAEPSLGTRSRVELAVRVLLLVALAAAAVVGLARPVMRTVADLEAALRAGQVRSVVLTVPPAEGSGSWQGVRWRPAGWGRAAVAQVHFDTTGTADPDDVAGIRAAVAAAPRHVALRLVADPIQPSGGVDLLGLPALLTLVVLVSGRQPRLVTKWGWFWLVCALPVLLGAFVLLEPLPLWRTDLPRERPGRLTGGKALLLGALVSGALQVVLPSTRGLLWRAPS